MNRRYRITSSAGMTALAALLLALTACGGETTGQEASDPEVNEPSVEEPTTDEEPLQDDDITGDDDAPTADDGEADEPSTPIVHNPTPPVDPAPQPPREGPKTPAPESPALADGTYEGRLASITTSEVTLELVRVLSGKKAIEAAEADGFPLDDGELPNDVYVQDLEKTVTMPVAGDGGFQIYDCSSGCELVGTTLDALANGTASPYGGAHAVVTIQVDAGKVVSLVEVYLP